MQEDETLKHEEDIHTLQQKLYQLMCRPKAPENTCESEEIASRIDHIVMQLNMHARRISKHVGLRIMQRRNAMDPRMSLQMLAHSAGINHHEILRRIEQGHMMHLGSLFLIAQAQKKDLSYYLDYFTENEHLNSDKKIMSLKFLNCLRSIKDPMIIEALLEVTQYLAELSANQYTGGESASNTCCSS